MASVPGVRLLPNAITVLAMCSGLSSFYFADLAVHGKASWLVPIGAIGAAAILDSLDGPAARLLRSTSRIGAELDSLSDLVSFGVAPALVIYQWQFLGGRGFGWVCCLVFAVCIGLRLARFNSLLDDDEPKPWAKGFFTGVPSTAAGLLALIPMLMALRFPHVAFWHEQWLSGGWLVVVGILAVSRVPSIALKAVRVSPAMMVPALILLVVGVAALFFEPELIFTIGLLVYLGHLPYAGWKYLHLKSHPELWLPAGGQSARPSGRRLRISVRMPRRRRVAGRAPDGSPLPIQRRRGTEGQPRRRRLR